MADATACITWVLRQEDATLSGKVVDLNDGAGPTRFGITRAAGPSASFYSLPASLALQEAVSIYRSEYWNRLCGDQINYQPLAASLLSFAINDGEGTEAKMLQSILGVVTDGAIGPQTVAAINAADGATLLARLQGAQWQHYQSVAARNPNDIKDLDGWKKRAFRTYPSLA